jgi:hypothetical protein
MEKEILIGRMELNLLEISLEIKNMERVHMFQMTDKYIKEIGKIMIYMETILLKLMGRNMKLLLLNE